MRLAPLRSCSPESWRISVSTSSRIATATGERGSDRTMATPRFVAAGTAMLFGMLTAMGAPRACSTSSELRPTLASDRLSTMLRASGAVPNVSSVLIATRRFLMAGMSRVAMSSVRSLASKAVSTCSVNDGGVSMTT